MLYILKWWWVTCLLNDFKLKIIRKDPSLLGRKSCWAVRALTKSIHTTWLSITFFISLVLSNPLSALMVSMYVDLGLRRFGWPWRGSHSNTLEAVSSVWRAQWPAYLNLLARIVSLTLGRLPYSSWLVARCLPVHIQGRSQHSGVASIDTFLQLLIHGPRFTSIE